MKKIAPAIAATLLCSASFAYAEDMAPAVAPNHMMNIEHMVDAKMKMMDTNGDGKVSRAEYDAYNDMMFKNADVSGDGMLTREELIDGTKKQMMAMHQLEATDSATIVPNSATMTIIKSDDSNATRNPDGTLSSEGNMKTGVTRSSTNDKDGNALPTTR